MQELTHGVGQHRKLARHQTTSEEYMYHRS
jgi:hypothetical protein